LRFTYVDPATVTGAYPLYGSTEGGANVIVRGSGFAQVGTAVGSPLVAECMFGSVRVPGTVVNGSVLSCLAPAHALASVPLHVSVNGIPASGAGLTYVYGPGPAITHVSPSAGPAQGGMVVNVTGTHFDTLSAGDAVQCLFGTTAVPALVLTTGAIQCSAPAAPVAGVVDLFLVVNGARLTLGAASYRYLDPAAVALVRPAYGSTRGGAMLTAYGLWFQSTSASCVFGGSTVPAVVFNSTALGCAVPPAAAVGSVPFGVVLDDVVLPSDVSFAYISPATVTAVQPTQGSTVAATAVTLTGTGFDPRDTFSCLFGTVAVNAAFVSSTKLVCSSPPQAAGTVTLSVSGPNLDPSSSPSVMFAYADVP
jgi:hypothetical protein